LDGLFVRYNSDQRLSGADEVPRFAAHAGDGAVEWRGKGKLDFHCDHDSQNVPLRHWLSGYRVDGHDGAGHGRTQGTV
jgi:hypothetical protein